MVRGLTKLPEKRWKHQLRQRSFPETCGVKNYFSWLSLPKQNYFFSFFMAT
jgi:hypothetical protein